MIYLDNAATSHPKPASVYARVDTVLRNWSANPGRSGHAMAIEAARIIFQTRESIARLFHIADPDRIIFTGNATGALNLAIIGLLRPGDRCVTTTMEHNSVIRPLRALERKGVKVAKVVAARDGSIYPHAVAAAIDPSTRLVVVTHASNVAGTITPIADTISLAHDRGVPVLVDAAQTAGSVPIDVAALGVDLLACPGHKGLLGPQGTGFLYIAPHLNPEPILFGGTGSQSDLEDMPDFAPDRYEAGTQNTPGIAGLGAGVEFLLEQGIEQIRAHELALLRQLMDGLATIDGLTIYGPRDPARKTGVVLFTIDGVDPAEIGDRLDQEFGIAVRVGLHCAPQAHRTLGTFPIGGVRMSPGYFNTAEEIDRAVEAVSRIAMHRTVAV
jgi:cysteine desulfurase / selenocysteine lyase